LPDARAGRESTLGLLPFFQVYGLSLGLNATLLLGGRLVLNPDADPESVVGTLERSSISYVPAIPALLRWLVDRRDLRSYRTVSLRSTFAVGAPLPTEVRAAFELATDAPVAAGYGMTETAGLTHAVPLGVVLPGIDGADQIGLPLPLTEVKVVELTAARKPVRPGGAGELLVRGPQVRDVELDADGFFATGDLVSVDPEGFTQFMCRVADVVRVGRSRIRPNVVEAPVLALPQVARAAAVQGYSRTGTAQLKLYVEPRPGVHLDIEMLRDACAASLSPGEVPAVIEIRPSLPLTGTGEVVRRALRDDQPARARAT
jgi:long-chain acyl-CoA synthetase